MSLYTVPPDEIPGIVDNLLPMLLQHTTKEELRKTLRECVGPEWPSEYINRETGKVYAPHHPKEHSLVYSNTPRYQLLKGGEGGGKSVAGIIKTLNRIGATCSGIVCSPDMPHFKKSLWPELQRWIPWDQVVDKHRNRGSFDWEPYAPFVLAFTNGARLYCGGMDEPGSWEGPNVNFAHFDEARRKKKPDALKVLDGRVRIPGQNGEEPQIWLTTTPRRHWLFDFFGPLKVQCSDCGSTEPVPIQEGVPFNCMLCESPNLIITDEKATFKQNSQVVTLLTCDNEANLEEGFATKRAQTLTAAEARVLLEAEWEDIEGGQPFLPHMSWWDDCREELPPLDKNEPLILGVDAATGRESGQSDCFAIVGVTRHPDPERRHDSVAVRYVKTWQAKTGDKIDFIGAPNNPGPERELLRLCGWVIDPTGKYVKLPRNKKQYNVKCITADPTELNDLTQRFTRKRIMWIEPFGQVNKRVKADNDFLRLIQQQRIAHDGDPTLRQHIANADRKLTEDGKRLRMVKREDSLKIDAGVATSMASNFCLYLQL